MILIGSDLYNACVEEAQARYQDWTNAIAKALVSKLNDGDVKINM